MEGPGVCLWFVVFMWALVPVAENGAGLQGPGQAERPQMGRARPLHLNSQSQQVWVLFLKTGNALPSVFKKESVLAETGLRP